MTLSATDICLCNGFDAVVFVEIVVFADSRRVILDDSCFGSSEFTDVCRDRIVVRKSKY